MKDIIIRPATPDDAAALQAIYAPYVTDTAITFEYEAPTVEEFRQRIVHTLEKFPYLVAEIVETGDGPEPVSKRIAGYAYVGTLRVRPAFQWCVETSIYLDRTIRHQGVGDVLLKALEEECHQRGFLNLYASIATVNPEDEHLTLDSYHFHLHHGYRLVGTFYQCGRKFGRWYDMVWMEKIIGPHTSADPRPAGRKE